MLLSPYHYNVFRQEMQTGKIKIIAFQSETDFAGGKSAAGRGAKKDKKEKKAKSKARGVDWLLAPWCLLGCFVRTHSTVPCVPTFFCSNTRNRPLCSQGLTPSFFALTVPCVHIFLFEHKEPSPVFKYPIFYPLWLLKSSMRP